ncbi:MAG: ester cyclase [Candidatus Bathyarchaeota archaeon]|nr:MAG: ester cyclase [Candidatus Bathyarchaeota archaeon]
MSVEANKAIIRKMVEAINTRKLSLLDELMASDFIMHMHNQVTQGVKENKQIVEGEIKAFHDFNVTIEDIIAEGDKVWARFTETGTHTGEYRGLTPTGNALSYLVVTIWRIVKGIIVEGWVVYDQTEFLRQLGVIEYTEQGKQLFPESE